MTAEDLLVMLRDRHVTLLPRAGGALYYKGSRRTLTPELLAAIREHQAALLALIETAHMASPLHTAETSAPLARDGDTANGAQALGPDYPCVVCSGTRRWNHAGLWRCVACWPPAAFGLIGEDGQSSPRRLTRAV